MNKNFTKEFILTERTQNLWADSAPTAVTKAVLAQPLITPWRLLLQQSCQYRQRPKTVAPMVLAAMVLSVCDGDTCSNQVDGIPPQMSGRRFLCVSMASGTRCSGVSSNVEDLSVSRFLVSDGHAEVLARRSLLSFLLDAVRSIRRDEFCSNCTASHQFVVRDSEKRGWHLRSDVQVHLVVTHWPCGSMALSATSQTGGHLLLRTPSAKLFGAWGEDCDKETEFRVTCPDDSVTRSTISVCHHILAAHKSVWEIDPRYTHCCRVKPGKGYPNMNMSCSDKLWRWSLFGLQGRRYMRVLTRPIRLSSIEVAIEMRASKENSGFCEYGRDQAKNALDSLIWKTSTLEEQVGASMCSGRPVLSLLPLPNISVFPIDELHVLGDDITQGTTGGNDSSYSRCTWMTNRRFCEKVRNTSKMPLSPREVNSQINSCDSVDNIVCSLGTKRVRVSGPVINTDNNFKIGSTQSQCAIEATWNASPSLTLNTKVGLPQGVNIQQLKRALKRAKDDVFLKYPLSRAWIEAQMEAAQDGITEDVEVAGSCLCELLPCKEDAFQTLLYITTNNSFSPEKKLLWTMKHHDLTKTNKHA
ncbi:unnamed protein product [Phytomonas sp. Hart1]|nr:unnamed protein product [Phytomonas sp. Hart1]|eukprot:CCW66135.1 unnamed protein product [Phytomonas sp. isolate Hart1]